MLSYEFDYTGLPDPAKWGYEVGLVRNYEKQCFTDARIENAYVGNGVLTVESRKEKYASAEYTSASLQPHENMENLKLKLK